MLQKHRKKIFISLLVSCGAVLHFIENMIPVPFPVPGAKLGLANIMSLIAIALYGLREGLMVNVLRCFIGALLAGSFSSLIYSLAGGVLSTIVMAFVYKHFSNVFSLVGVSLLGGVTHNFVQVTVASLILSTFGLYVYLPFLMIIGLFTGLFTGLVACFVKQNLDTTLVQMDFFEEEKPHETK